MKKIFLLLTVFSLVFTSCDPLEDINKTIDAQAAADGIVGDVTRTLSDEDYSDLGLSFGNFSSRDDAKADLPAFLTDKYPALGVTYNEDGSVKEASSALITYNLYSPIQKETYTVSAADYTAIGLANLTTNGEFNTFFDYKYPSVDQGTVVNLTYQTLAPTIDYTLTDADFTLVGNGQYNNFDIRAGRAEETIESRRVKIETILLANFPNASTGQMYMVTYAVYDGSSSTRTMLVQLNGTPGYDLINGYTLTNADYALVGNGNYNNFDIRAGRAEETEESRRAKIETILLANFPAAAAGDQYFVTYAIYNGSAGTRTMLVELNAAATGYTIVSATVIEETASFTYITSWNPPLTFTNAEYTLMGQNHPNFSNRDVAAHNIGIYLKTLYPFANADDFVAVAYNYYSGGVTVRNVNFVFDGTVWNAIPSVIDAELKFGHNGTTWVPDNTIKYTLTNADYASVGNGNYNNFDIRTGRDEETIAARLAKINTILLANFPGKADGQKFSVTYAIYDGANGFRVMNVIKAGAEYILQ